MIYTCEGLRILSGAQERSSKYQFVLICILPMVCPRVCSQHTLCIINLSRTTCVSYNPINLLLHHPFLYTGYPFFLEWPFSFFNSSLLLWPLKTFKGYLTSIPEVFSPRPQCDREEENRFCSLRLIHYFVISTLFPYLTQVCVILHGRRPVLFDLIFFTWSTRTTSESKLIECYWNK